MTQQCFSLIRGRAMRVTKLNGCGGLVYGSQSSVVTKGFISVGFTANTEEGEPISIPNANGDICISDTPAPKFTGYGVEINLCGVDPSLVGLLTGQPLVADPDTGTGSPAEYVGFRMDTATNLDDSGFGLELWSAVPTSVCGTTGEQLYGYLLFPFLKGGIIGDFTLENGALNFTVTGAQTKDGSGWSEGPYDVVPSTGTDEVQTVTITGTPAGGNFKLIYDGQTTANIAHNATAAAVRTALGNLSNIGADNVAVTGGPGPGTPYVVTFTNALGGQDVSLMTASNTFSGGTSPDVAVTLTTPGGSGSAGPLTTPITSTQHMHLQLTSVAPPTDQCGAQPVGTEATGATEVEGSEATLTPSESYAPWDLADANDGTFTASPGTAWSTGSYVLTESGEHIYWTSTTWATGDAP